jgi:pimeloyl-ACP methyl ester carboxylesterase
MTPTTIELRGHHGIALAADVLGHEHGWPVLLLHGGGQTRHAWGETANILGAHGYRAISIDARGHGDSAWDPQGRYDIDFYARDIIAVCEMLMHQCGAKPALVGASLGGTSSMTAIGLHGLDARALVLVDIAPHLEPSGVERILGFMGANPHGSIPSKLPRTPSHGICLTASVRAISPGSPRTSAPPPMAAGAGTGIPPFSPRCELPGSAWSNANGRHERSRFPRCSCAGNRASS